MIFFALFSLKEANMLLVIPHRECSFFYTAVTTPVGFPDHPHRDLHIVLFMLPSPHNCPAFDIYVIFVYVGLRQSQTCCSYTLFTIQNINLYEANLCVDSQCMPNWPTYLVLPSKVDPRPYFLFLPFS